MSSCRMGHKQKVCETAVRPTTNEIEVVGKIENGHEIEGKCNCENKNKNQQDVPESADGHRQLGNY